MILKSHVKGLPIFQYVATFTATLNLLCSGMFFAWPSPSLPKLFDSNSGIPITNDQGSWVAVMFLIGGVCGALIAGVIIDRIGRKNVMLLAALPFFSAWMMVAYVRSVELLLVARFMAGIADGFVFSATCIYLGEISDPSIRGFIGSSMTILHISGMLLINIIGSCLSIKTTALIASSLPVLFFSTFSWMPESPYYLIMKGRLEDARRSLERLKGTRDVDQELNRLMEAIKEQNSNTGKYLDLITVKSNRKATFIIMGARAAQQFTGAMAIVFYAQMIFQETGDAISPSVGSIIYFTVQVIFAIVCASIVDRTGRRPLMILSLSGITVALLIESCYFYIKNLTDIDTTSFTWVSIAGLILFVAMFSLGMQTIPLLLAGEVFPTNVKAFAVSYADVYFCVVTTTASKFFQFTKDEFGLHVPFSVFAVCGVLGILFTIWFVPETKGKTLEEIQEELKSGTKKQNSEI